MPTYLRDRIHSPLDVGAADPPAREALGTVLRDVPRE